MGTALKKHQDYHSLTRIRWAAWGVIDIEALERMQRRNYIKHVRQELKIHDLHLECGGNAVFPYYRIYREEIITTTATATARDHVVARVLWSTTSAASSASARQVTRAFSKVCRDVLEFLEPQGSKQEPHNE